jgi:quinol-cytochrome oxidoreductase complex cytochrome b subunit
VAVLPFLWLTLISLHLWRIRKDGGLAAPEEAEAERIPSSPWLFRAELTVGLLTVSLLFCLAFFIPAPLADRADSLHPPNPAKAPWYFVGIHEMVSYSATLGGVLIPLWVGLFLFFAPVLDRAKQAAGKWFERERLTLNMVFALILIGQLVMIVIGQWFRVKNWALTVPW